MSVTWNTDHDMPAAKAAQADVRAAVRAALLAAGPEGLTSTDLYARFGPHAVKRLNDLRKDGWDYSRHYEGRSGLSPIFRYVLFRREGDPALRATRDPFGQEATRVVSQAARILRARRSALAVGRADLPTLF